MQKPWKIDEATIDLLQNQENWSGSFYELALAFDAEQLDEQRRRHLLQEVWSDSQLQGVVSERSDFGKGWLAPADASTVAGHDCYGCMRLGNGQIIGCGSCFIEVKPITWFVLYIPLAMLGLVFPVSYPLIKQDNRWHIEIDEKLASVGMRIYRMFSFQLGVMGEEAGATVSLDSLQDEVRNDEGLLVPERLFHQLDIPPRGTRSAEGLWWTGATTN